jgi:hypothetical protein
MSCKSIVEPNILMYETPLPFLAQSPLKVARGTESRGADANFNYLTVKLTKVVISFGLNGRWDILY